MSGEAAAEIEQMRRERAEHLARRDVAIKVRCPVEWCDAPVGSGCYYNEWTSMSGPIHDERLTLAGSATGDKR